MSHSSFQTPYHELGGAETIERLVEAFYSKVIQDPDLSPLFPEGIEEIKKKQSLFLTQFLGGPTAYSDIYGPPAMRARHLRFEVTPQRAKAWLNCMEAAMEEVNIEPNLRETIFIRLTQVAFQMVNCPDKYE